MLVNRSCYSVSRCHKMTVWWRLEKTINVLCVVDLTSSWQIRRDQFVRTNLYQLFNTIRHVTYGLPVRQVSFVRINIFFKSGNDCLNTAMAKMSCIVWIKLNKNNNNLINCLKFLRGLSSVKILWSVLRKQEKNTHSPDFQQENLQCIQFFQVLLHGINTETLWRKYTIHKCM